MILSSNIFENLYEQDIMKPDVYYCNNVNSLICVENNFVISRNNDGTVLSQYKDNIWDLTPYSTGVDDLKLNFKQILSVKHQVEVKRLLFMIMISKGGAGTSSLSPRTLYLYLQTLFKPLSEYSLQNNTSISKLFEDTDSILRYAKTHLKSNVGTHLPPLMSFIKLLFNLSSEYTGIIIDRRSDIITKLSKMFYDNLELNQTKLIPTSIYNASTKERWNHLEKVEHVLDNFLEFIKKTLECENYALKSNKMNLKKKGFVEWYDAVESYDLIDFFEGYNIGNRKEFYFYLEYLHGTLRHLVHTYTGMRRSELLMLKNDSLSIEKDIKNSCFIGITKKIHGTEHVTKWVTVNEMKRVVGILTNINQLLADYHGINIVNMPLFIRMTLYSKRNIIPSKITAISNKNTELFLSNAAITITEEDILELENIDPFRDWRSELKVGDKWNFTSHQYRRSLAIYALQSGIVSYRTLQTQFAHLFREMTFYYTKGSSRAKDILGTSSTKSDHVSKDMIKLKPLIDFISYANCIANTNEQKFGAHGNFLEKHELSSIIYQNKNNTLKKFNNGQMSFCDTAIGGCTTTTPCDKKLIRSMISCINCDSGIIFKSKLECVIYEQEILVNKLKENRYSVEYRTELEDLEILKTKYKFISKKENVNE